MSSWQKCFEEIPITDHWLNVGHGFSDQILTYGALCPIGERARNEGFVRAFRGPLEPSTVSWYTIMRWTKVHLSERRFIMRYFDEDAETIYRAILFKQERNARMFKHQWCLRYPLE